MSATVYPTTHAWVLVAHTHEHGMQIITTRATDTADILHYITEHIGPTAWYIPDRLHSDTYMSVTLDSTRCRGGIVHAWRGDTLARARIFTTVQNGLHSLRMSIPERRASTLHRSYHLCTLKAETLLPAQRFRQAFVAAQKGVAA